MAKEVVKQENKQFVFDWYKELNWKSNPFEYRYLFPISEYITGYNKERKKLNLFIIENSSIGLIKGNEGYGKTTLILWLKHELMRYKDRIIVDYVDKNINLVELVKLLIKPLLKTKENAVIKSNILHLEKGASLIADIHLRLIYESVYLKKKDLDFESIKDFLYRRLENRHLILLIDDVDELPEQSKRFVDMLVNNHLNLQMILSSSSNLEMLNKRKDLIKIELEGLSFDEAKEMLSKRIEGVGGNGLEPFTEEHLKAIYQKNNKSPLSFLSLCKDKAIKLALNKINGLKEAGTMAALKQNVESNSEEKEESVQNEKKSYEIKVMNHQTNSNYEIKMVNPGDKEVPLKVNKEERKATKVEKNSDNQEEKDKQENLDKWHKDKKKK